MHVFHVSDEELLAFAAGERGEHAAESIGRHVAACRRCAQTVARYQQVSAAVRLDDSETPPPATVARAQALMAHEPRYPARGVPRRPPGRHVFAGALLLALLLVLLGLPLGAQVAGAASEGVLPGDMLYPLKTAFEDVRLALASDAADQVALHLDFARRRIREMEALAAQQRYRDMTVAGTGFELEADSTADSLRELANRDPQRASIAAARALEVLARARLDLNVLLASVPGAEKPLLEGAIGHAESAGSAARGEILSGTSTPQATTAATPLTAATSAPTGTSAPVATATQTETPAAPIPATAYSTTSAPLDTPPGPTATAPGQANSPPGQLKTPPGQAKTPPGQAKTPPGQAKTPPGQAKTPPGQAKTPKPKKTP